MRNVYRVTKNPGVKPTWDARRVLDKVGEIPTGFIPVYCCANVQHVEFWADMAGLDGPVMKIPAIKVWSIVKAIDWSVENKKFLLVDVPEYKTLEEAADWAQDMDLNNHGSCEPAEFIALVPEHTAVWEYTGTVIKPIFIPDPFEY